MMRFEPTLCMASGPCIRAKERQATAGLSRIATLAPPSMLWRNSARR